MSLSPKDECLYVLIPSLNCWVNPECEFGEDTGSSLDFQVPFEEYPLTSSRVTGVVQNCSHQMQVGLPKSSMPWWIKGTLREQDQGMVDRVVLSKTSKHLLIFSPVIKVYISEFFSVVQRLSCLLLQPFILLRAVKYHTSLEHPTRPWAPWGLACILLLKKSRLKKKKKKIKKIRPWT